MKTWKFILYILLLASCNTLETPHALTDVDFPLEQDWSFTTEEHIQWLSVSDDWAVISEPLKLTAVDVNSGKLLWSRELIMDSDSLPLFSSELLAVENMNRVKIINRTGDEVVSFDLDRNDENAELMAFHSPYLFFVRRPSWVLEIYSIETESKLWSIPIGRGGVNIGFDTFEDISYITTLNFISAYDTTNGDLVWEYERKASTSTFDSGVLYFYEVTSAQNYLSAFDTTAQKNLWQLEIGASTGFEVYNITVLGDYLITATNDGLIAINKTDGRYGWKTESNINFATSPIIVDSTIFARGTSSRTIYAISPASGRYLGYLKLDDPPTFGIPDYEFRSAVMATGKSILFYYDRNVYSYKESP